MLLVVRLGVFLRGWGGWGGVVIESRGNGLVIGNFLFFDLGLVW